MNGDRPAGVCAVIDPEQGDHGTMEVHGTLDTASFHRALHRVAEIRPAARHPGPRLVRHGPDLHTVELPGGDGAPAPAAVGLLADLLTAAPQSCPDAGPAAAPAGPPCRTLPRTEPVTPLQQQRLADALTWPDHQVEQVLWRWYGPLDTARLEAAWHAVATRESVLRTAFVWDPRPRAVVFDRGVTDVVRHPHGTAIRRAELPARERARAFDLRRPAAVRLALLDSGPHDEAAPFTDVLLTYHRALLDSWSVRLLMRECCRAYLADGALPGGERRPDLGDCARRLGTQDPGPAHDFWRGPLHRPAAPGPHPARPAGGGTGVLRAALPPARSTRLAHWAARWGVAESSVLQAVWALLLYRARDTAPAGATVGFGLDFPGRGLLLEGIEGVPGPFEKALPVTVALDPALDLPHLLRTLRDLVMDLSAYEWTTAGTPATGAGPGPRAGGLLAFDCGPRPETAYGGELAAHGIRIEEQEAAGAPAGYALRLRAGHDTRRGLVLTCAYDRDLVDDGTARTLLAHTVRLLRLLPATAGATTTVGDVLALMPHAATPRVPDGPPAWDAAPLVPLRGAPAPARATVCLLDAPGAPHTGQQEQEQELVRHYRGPEALTALRLTAGRQAAHTDALTRLARSSGRLVLGGYSGAGALACELARQITGPGVRPPLVVVGGAGDDPDGPRSLARALQRASASAART
ncbi:condensation domain-containing protein [Streptomyces sp. STR69]|uniref:condensation domain-containing protein n=1 Tax=Streptomyces sp. STR69 TaxID=1796942 RepID=UPI0021C9286D|nr:condensation domain-containing protein [Streptomyces sp. STR69]